MPPTSRTRDDAPAPRHHKVFTVLREQILEGRYYPDEPMPGEIELSGMFDVSRVTIRRALERLQKDGLILRRQGIGTFACAELPQKPQEGNLNGLMDNLLLYGLKTDVEVLEFRYMTPPPDIALSLEIEADEIVQKAVRLRSFKGRPISFVTTYIPEFIGRKFTEDDLRRERLLALLSEASGGIASAHQRISATTADPNVAELLDVEYGAALLYITRLVRDHRNVPINHLRALYRPDSYQFSMDLTMDSSPQGPLWQASVGIKGPDEDADTNP